jgi:hypothetical protein
MQCANIIECDKGKHDAANQRLVKSLIEGQTNL